MTKASIKMTVEVHLSQPWGDDESAKNVFKRAKDQGEEVLARCVGQWNASGNDNKIYITSKASVTAVITNPDER